MEVAPFHAGTGSDHSCFACVRKSCNASGVVKIALLKLEENFVSTLVFSVNGIVVLTGKRKLLAHV